MVQLLLIAREIIDSQGRNEILRKAAKYDFIERNVNLRAIMKDR
jgi:hypothetical protein